LSSEKSNGESLGLETQQHRIRAAPVIPKTGEVVAVDVMMDTIINARMAYGTYFALKEKVLGKNWGYPPSPSAEADQTKPN